MLHRRHVTALDHETDKQPWASSMPGENPQHRPVVTIMEAARLLGDVSDKTIRRAIRSGKLAARYPRSNKAEILIDDLEAWYAQVQPKIILNKLNILEYEIDRIASRVYQMEQTLESLSDAKKPQYKSSKPAPQGFVWLSDFASQHGISMQFAERVYETGAIPGQRIRLSSKQAPIAITAKGQYEFIMKTQGHVDFLPCNDCPHCES
jgi:hypothetical protein